MNLRNAEKYLMSEKDQMQSFASKFKSSRFAQAMTGLARSTSATNLARRYEKYMHILTYMYMFMSIFSQYTQ